MKAFTSLLLVTAAVQASVIERDNGSPNFASIAAQPQPQVTGPAPGAVTQVNTINNAQATSTGAAAATDATSNSKRNFCACWFNVCWGWCPQPSSTSTPGWGWPAPTTSQPKPTSAPCTSTSHPTTTASSWSKPATCTSTPYTPYYPATSTITPSNTGTVSSGTACPTQPEAGTYCGFINPEDPCAPQPDGYGPVPSPDTAASFESDPLWAQDANAAVAPAGFDRVFTNLNASVSAANFLSLVTLESYDANACASACECTEGCSAFNLYVERDPSQNPSDPSNTAPSVWGNNCPNPASMTSYKCTLWGGPISAADATNYGQYRDKFQVVVAGSNGYNAQPNNPSCTPPPQPGWGNGHHCPGGGVNPGKGGCGGHFFPGPFDPRICAAYADAQAQKNKDACAPGGSYTPVNFWNAYSLTKDGQFWGMYCALFSDQPSDVDGSYTGGFFGGSSWEVEWSWSQCHSQDSWDSGIKSS